MTERYNWDVIEGDPIFYDNGAVIDYDDVVECLNNYDKENKKNQLRINTFIEGNKTLQARLKGVSIENKNTKAVLEDFMDILNKIQANPTDEKLLNIAKDMLQNMGVGLND